MASSFDYYFTSIYFFTDVDIDADTYVQNYTILINETEIFLSAITIVDDMIPETDEEFTLSLMKGEDTEDLNVFPSTSVVRMTILDDDGRYFIVTHVFFAE